jgi:hypothetical protein
MMIKLFDGTQYTVDQDRGEEIARAIAQSKDGMVRLGGGLIKLSAIASILPGGQVEADRNPNDPNYRLRTDYRNDEEIYKSAREKSSEVRKKLERKGILKPKRPSE